ncbi:MAG TPA: helix-turn-helix transcriptional regulator [Candidatus Galloscillospira stercoripullorum]|nr:helix-turn-helix transcriptional regulator [Candidatus Galloscillospira stercoripullorum]
MPIILDHQLREQIPHAAAEFPVRYYHDELSELPDWAGPFHWHPDFEIATAARNVLDYQVGQQHVALEPGESIFVNGNVLHRVRQASGGSPDPVPIILFSAAAIAPEHSVIHQKYIQPVARCDGLPFIVFRGGSGLHGEVNRLIQDTCRRLSEGAPCYEMAVQRNINSIFEYIFCNLKRFPRYEATRVQLKSQIRLQKMLTYIYEHYAQPVTLQEIAASAHISRSEAGRCFRTYMDCSPVEALIGYRLQTARRLLGERSLTLQEISAACGFHSVNYFSRAFRKAYGCAPGQDRSLGK